MPWLKVDAKWFCDIATLWPCNYLLKKAIGQITSFTHSVVIALCVSYYSNNAFRLIARKHFCLGK